MYLDRTNSRIGQQYYYNKLRNININKSQIELDEVIVLNKLKFTSKKERIRYLILRRKTLKVYPYATMAAERLVKLNERLGQLKSRSKRRKYTRRVQKFIEEELILFHKLSASYEDKYSLKGLGFLVGKPQKNYNYLRFYKLLRPLRKLN